MHTHVDGKVMIIKTKIFDSMSKSLDVYNLLYLNLHLFKKFKLDGENLLKYANEQDLKNNFKV